MMKNFFIFIIFTIISFADMGQMLNLELFDNSNPALITDIEDEVGHFIINSSIAYTQIKKSNIYISQEQAYNISLSGYKRINNVVLFIKFLHKIFGIATDPTHTKKDLRLNYSEATFGIATTFFDLYDLGFSYEVSLKDNNTTNEKMQVALRYADDINLAAVFGLSSLKNDILVKNYQPFVSVGFSVGETSNTVFDLSLTYKIQSSTVSNGLLLRNVQPKVLQSVVQLQNDDNFNRLGIRYEYQKKFATIYNSNQIMQKIQLQTGMKVERKPNSYAMFFISYKNEKSLDILNESFEIGVSLRGFYP